MSIFDRIRGGRANQAKPTPNNPNSWDNPNIMAGADNFQGKNNQTSMDTTDNSGRIMNRNGQVYFETDDGTSIYMSGETGQEALKEQEHQDKMIMALANASDGQLDMDALERKDIEVSAEVRDKVIADFASGRITDNIKMHFLNLIGGPINFQHRNGNDSQRNRFANDATRIRASLANGSRELKILGYIIGDEEGFKKANNLVQSNELGPDYITRFIEKYPNPLVFEQKRNNFLDMIEKTNNSKEKRRQYESAMDSFQQKLYGKKYTYWKIMQNFERFARQSFGSSRRVSATPARASQPSPQPPANYAPSPSSNNQSRGNFYSELRVNDGEDYVSPSNAEDEYSAWLMSGDLSPDDIEMSTRRADTILYAFAYHINGQPNMKGVNAIGVNLSEAARNQVLDDFTHNKISDASKMLFLRGVRSPDSLNAEDAISSHIEDQQRFRRNARFIAHEITSGSPRESQILSYIYNGAAGFNLPLTPSSDLLEKIITTYPEPMSFENRAQDLLDSLERSHGRKQRLQYEAALMSLQQKLYGEKNDYWQEMKRLERFAKDYPRPN